MLTSIGSRARLDLLGQAEWWVTIQGWQPLLATYKERREVVETENDFGMKHSEPKTYTIPTHFRLESRLETLDADTREKIRVTDMSLGHRQAVVSLLWQDRRKYAHAALFEIFVTMAGADDGCWASVQGEIDELERSLDNDPECGNWFNRRPLIVALRASIIETRDAKIASPVLLG